jgi:hypothetical protein
MASMTKMHQKEVRKNRLRVHSDKATVRNVVDSMTLFFRQAAEKAQDPAVRSMFISMADEEQKQLEAFGSASETTGAVAYAIRRMIRSLEESKRRLLKTIGSTTDDVDALKIALEIEKEGIRLYERILPKVTTPGQKAIVSRLLNDEKQRYAAIENTCLLFSDPDNWYLWNEQGIMDGGTPWA